MFFFSTFPGAEVLINLSYLELRASLAFNRATLSQNSVYLYRHRCIFGFFDQKTFITQTNTAETGSYDSTRKHRAATANMSLWCGPYFNISKKKKKDLLIAICKRCNAEISRRRCMCKDFFFPRRV